MSWIELYAQKFPDSPVEAVPKPPKPTSGTSVTTPTQESQKNPEAFVASSSNEEDNERTSVTFDTRDSVESRNESPIVELVRSLNLLREDYDWLHELLALHSDKTVKTAVAGYRSAWAAGLEVQRMPPTTDPDDYARRIANSWIRNLMERKEH